jgi:hypothetical protein
MTEKQIEYGFWNWDKENNFPPNSISYSTQYNGETLANIACTQRTTLSPTEQKKLVKEWVHFLPTCRNLEMLWFTTKISQDIFESVCLLDQLVGLNIKTSSIKSLDKISNLKNLKYLRIGDSSKIESIQPLENMTNLEALVIENFKNISDFSIISNLKNLKYLSIEGGMNKAQNILSFNPIGELTDLVFLSILMVNSPDKSIEPIYKLKKLKTLNWGYSLTENEMNQLKNELPNLIHFPHRHVEENLRKIKALFK